MSRTILIDGDIIAYEAASANEKNIDWGDGLWTLHCTEEAVTQTVNAQINGLQEKLGADRVVVALSDGANWRKTVLPTYKSNRTGVRKPVCLAGAKQHMRDTFEVFERPTLEADDILGILATASIIPGEKVIVSIDKDLKTIPGLHYDWRKAEEGVFEVSEEEADYWHLYQTLTGDVTDGYSGCPGVGPKKAEGILKVNPTWAAVVAAYEKAGLNETVALQMARVARILRKQDYDFKKKEVILWTP